MKREAVQEERARKEKSENNNNEIVDSSSMGMNGQRGSNAVNAIYQQSAAVLEMMPIERVTEAEVRVDQKQHETELHVSR